MGDRADQSRRVAIIGLACRFPGAGDPVGFHDLTVAGSRMFRPTAGPQTGLLHAALLDDWSGPAASGDPAGQDAGAVQKLAAETTALALADAGLKAEEIVAGAPGRAGLSIASSAAGVGELVRGQSGLTGDADWPRTAAASSLHAVAAAAEALRAGNLDLAVAGGAELGLDPAWLTAAARAGTLGRDEMRVYAAEPCGLLPGEGCGIVVLVRSADAHAAGVPIYAEIAGWSTVPVSPSALDDRAILQAYQQAGIDPADIQLIEGEGRGTAAGDLAELTAFGRLRQGGRATAALGAVAAGIGYTRAAAGIASLIKTALAMAVGTIPSGTRCARQHRLIETGEALLRLPRVAEPWPDGNTDASGRRLAAVNSLGTADPAAGPGPAGHPQAEGVHLVLCREAEPERGRGRRRRTADTASASPPVPVSAAPAAPAPPVTAGTLVDERAPIGAETRVGAGGATAGAGSADVNVPAGARGRVVVVFGGLARAGLAQSGTLAASLAGLRTLDLIGVTPVAAVGYSLGELAGLVWAGCLPAAEAARLAAQRGQVLRGYGDGPAAMARVAADAETARELGAPEGLHIAGYEGARSHLLAGSAASIRNLTRRAAAAGVAVEVLGIALALHSPAMAGCAAPLRSVLAGTRFAPPRRRLISTVTGRPVMPGDDLAELLASQLSRPVLFARAMALAAAQADLIVVAGPDDGLAGLAADCCAAPVVTIPSVPVTGGPGGRDPSGYARLAEALIAAGAISDVSALAPSAPAPSAPAPSALGGTWAIPLTSAAGPGHGQDSGQDSGQEVGTGTTVRSV
jgi:enediyne polyketide synthase